MWLNKSAPTNLETGLEDNLLPLETDVLGPLDKPWEDMIISLSQQLIRVIWIIGVVAAS